jgi:DNA methyltransferase 1-associated protein 1
VVRSSISPTRRSRKRGRDEIDEENREQREFANEARTDALKLRHWAKAESDPQAEYPFRKYDVPTPVFTYNDDEYTRLLSSTFPVNRSHDSLGLNKYLPSDLPVPGEDGEPGESWSREETDYLFDLLREYDLRWYVVADRWEFGGPERKLHVSVSIYKYMIL